jgi:DNA invertase Pin-like site-specific DNA recombinase
MDKLVAYYRVSTKRQGESGLGLAGQQSDVERYARGHGGEVIRQFVEVESGKRRDRPELAKALAFAKRAKATLVVAKLDRLARNVAFTSSLMEAGVDFVACDNPHANRLTIHILAAVAEDEARRISERTKTALAIAKKRGVMLGSSRPNHWKGRENRRRAGAKAGGMAAADAHRRTADEAYADLIPMMSTWRGEGRSLQQIADALNDEGYRTRRSAAWNRVQVGRVLQRQEQIAAR